MESNQSKIHRILELYWGYKQFRSLQEEIILHILEGKDALALLPTGGGKSICFQVPALVLEGVCIVVSPLIALMKDQIENLKKRDIAAEAIYSGLSEAETDLYLNQAVFGRLKFLYVSPERCKNEKFIAHLKQMKVCLLAVDEAHCISQWGYDFRPAYLEISSLRDYLPGVPLLALTATATKEVVEDIQKKLHIQPFKLFQKSFQRDNLTYYVIEEEDKFGRLLRIIRKVKGSGIVYVRNRRKTVDVADFLCRNGISAASYHAGLSTSLRNQRQENWKEDRVQVIVATNAFGMGIDKSNVRFVVHVDLPDTLEAYFQEAGRGGRDGKRAFAILLYHPSDKKEVEERFSKTYPELVFIKNVYEALGNYYQIPVGMGEGSVFKIDIKEFCNTYKLPIIETFSALGFLQKEGLLTLSENLRDTSKVRMLIAYEDAYKFAIEHPDYEFMIQDLLRSYGGRMFSDYVSIYEKDLAQHGHSTEEKIVASLCQLHSWFIIDYQPLQQGISLTYVSSRVDFRKNALSPQTYMDRKKNAQRKLDAVLDYVSASKTCRSLYLLHYFGEQNETKCKHCDVCLGDMQKRVHASEYESMLCVLRPLLQEKALDIRQVIELFPQFAEEKICLFWQHLLEEDNLEKVGTNSFRWKNQ